MRIENNALSELTYSAITFLRSSHTGNLRLHSGHTFFSHQHVYITNITYSTINKQANEIMIENLLN